MEIFRNNVKMKENRIQIFCIRVKWMPIRCKWMIESYPFTFILLAWNFFSVIPGFPIPPIFDNVTTRISLLWHLTSGLLCQSLLLATIPTNRKIPTNHAHNHSQLAIRKYFWVTNITLVQNISYAHCTIKYPIQSNIEELRHRTVMKIVGSDNCNKKNIIMQLLSTLCVNTRSLRSNVSYH